MASDETQISVLSNAPFLNLLAGQPESSSTKKLNEHVPGQCGDDAENADKRSSSDLIGAQESSQVAVEKNYVTEMGERFSPESTVLDIDKVLRAKASSPLSSEVIEAPFVYIQSLPGKGIRNKIIDALNVWLDIPEESTEIIKRVISLLHQSSLMFDDIQDSSNLRRGMPSAHTIFGVPQTINSASYKITQALDEVLNLGSMSAIRIVLDELKILYLGQSFDLYWTCNLVCPSAEEHIKMLDSKTGGLFRMLLKLLEALSTSDAKPDLHFLITLLGRHFAIRDDYQNLRSDDYSNQKGFCEDLDEGKYSLLLIHVLHHLPEDQSMTLRNMLTQRRINNKSPHEHKQLILQFMEQSGSFDYTLAVLRHLQVEIDKEIQAVEQVSGIQNEALKTFLTMIFI